MNTLHRNNSEMLLIDELYETSVTLIYLNLLENKRSTEAISILVQVLSCLVDKCCKFFFFSLTFSFTVTVELPVSLPFQEQNIALISLQQGYRDFNVAIC